MQNVIRVFTVWFCITGCMAFASDAPDASGHMICLADFQVSIGQTAQELMQTAEVLSPAGKRKFYAAFLPSAYHPQTVDIFVGKCDIPQMVRRYAVCQIMAHDAALAGLLPSALRMLPDSYSLLMVAKQPIPRGSAMISERSLIEIWPAFAPVFLLNATIVAPYLEKEISAPQTPEYQKRLLARVRDYVTCDKSDEQKKSELLRRVHAALTTQ